MSDVETARATMRAWAIDVYGGPERIQIRRLPVTEPGDVLIEMSGADQTYAWDAVCGTDAFERLTLFTAKDSRNQSAAAVSERLRWALEQCRPSALAMIDDVTESESAEELHQFRQ